MSIRRLSAKAALKRKKAEVLIKEADEIESAITDIIGKRLDSLAEKLKALEAFTAETNAIYEANQKTKADEQPDRNLGA